MGLLARPELFEGFPGLRVAVVVARGITPPSEPEAVDRFWSEAYAGAAAAREHGNAQFHPRVAPWRAGFKALGVSGKRFPTSIEAMLRRAMKGGEPFRIHPLVDFYNAVSLRHVLPAGGYDLDEIDGEMEVRLTREGDTFRALDDAAAEPVPPGELAYACGGDVLTRHLVWRQSERALIRPATTRAVLVSEALAEVGDEVLDEVAGELASGLERWFGAETSSHRITEASPSVDW